MAIDAFLLKIKRGESPSYRFLTGMGRRMMRSTLPAPRLLFPLLRFLYHLHFAVLFGMRWLLNYFYREPLFRSRCVSVGRNFSMWLMPDITGHPKIYIGDNVNFFGHVGIVSGRIFDEPKLIVEDGVDVGHDVIIVVNKEVVFEQGVKIASGCRFMDTDAHPRDTGLRAANAPPPPDEIKPVRICRNAWIGQNSFILKGVTVGEGAVVGVNSVVVSDIPPFSVAMGNPARVIIKNPRPS